MKLAPGTESRTQGRTEDIPGIWKIARSKLNFKHILQRTPFAGKCKFCADMFVKKSLYTSGQAKIAQTIREMREEAGLTQRDLSAKIDRPRNVIARIEQAQRRVDLLEWIALCEVCGVDPVQKGKKLLAQLNTSKYS